MLAFRFSGYMNTHRAQSNKQFLNLYGLTLAWRNGVCICDFYAYGSHKMPEQVTEREKEKEKLCALCFVCVCVCACALSSKWRKVRGMNLKRFVDISLLSEIKFKTRINFLSNKVFPNRKIKLITNIS